MFCPSCGIEEKQATQFCRACGTDLQGVRRALDTTDQITASAASARAEIGRAFAAKIREAQTGNDLKTIAERVLPQIEEFLETPAEKRLRRLRIGTLMSLIGLGTTIAFIVVAAIMNAGGLLVLTGLSIVIFFIGLAIFINGLFLSVPKKSVLDKLSEAENQRARDILTGEIDAKTNELVLPEARQTFVSVTEDSTRHLKEKPPAARR